MNITEKEIFDRVDALLREGGGVIIAVDGRCGSGKTTLAARLHAKFGGNLYHMDDYYLPFAQRIEGWRETPAANMDLTRFEAEVLAPAKAGKAVHYRPFSCPKREYLSESIFAPARLSIVEGTYSTHPKLAGYYALKIFSTCAKPVQKARLTAREGAHYAAFEEIWIPLEEAYFANFDIQKNADCVLDTADAQI